MIVRLATLDDLDAVTAMGQRMVDESTAWFPRVDMERSRQTFEMAAAAPDMLHMTVAVPETDIPAGFLIAYKGDYPYSTVLRGSIDTIYIAPEYRRGRAGPMLLAEALVWFGDVRPIIIGDSAGIEPEAFARFVTHYGFAEAGMIYRMEAR